MRKLFWLGALFPLLMSLNAVAQGGPPMVTDDPGTPGDGHWEINIAGLFSKTNAQEILQAPYFDINYGWGERTQLKLETGWVKTWDQPSSNHHGVGTALVGVKHRFLDEDESGVAVSTYPQVQLHHSLSSQDPEVAAPGNQFILPLEFMKGFGSWAVNPEVGFLHDTEGANAIFYGVVLAYEKAKPWELLAEVHVNQALESAGRTTLINFGLRYTANSKINVLASLGHTVTTLDPSLPELDAYLGIQLEL